MTRNKLANSYLFHALVGAAVAWPAMYLSLTLAIINFWLAVILAPAAIGSVLYVLRQYVTRQPIYKGVAIRYALVCGCGFFIALSLATGVIGPILNHINPDIASNTIAVSTIVSGVIVAVMCLFVEKRMTRR